MKYLQSLTTVRGVFLLLLATALLSLASCKGGSGKKGGACHTQLVPSTTGNAHTCAIVNGAAKCWGLNGGGRLGDNSTTE